MLTAKKFLPLLALACLAWPCTCNVQAQDTILERLSKLEARQAAQEAQTAKNHAEVMAGQAEIKAALAKQQTTAVKTGCWVQNRDGTPVWMPNCENPPGTNPCPNGTCPVPTTGLVMGQSFSQAGSCASCSPTYSAGSLMSSTSECGGLFAGMRSRREARQEARAARRGN